MGPFPRPFVGDGLPLLWVHLQQSYRARALSFLGADGLGARPLLLKVSHGDRAASCWTWWGLLCICGWGGVGSSRASPTRGPHKCRLWSRGLGAQAQS